jgi:hypothetical protein
MPANDHTIGRLARALVAAQGNSAPEVAEQTARSFMSSGDEPNAEKWRSVADRAAKILARMPLLAFTALFGVLSF